jgi:hypothetical protein
MRLKQRSLNWINSMQVEKILFTNVFFSWSLCLLNMFSSFDYPKEWGVYLLLKQQWKCKIICHFVTNGEHLYVFSR